MNYLRLLSPRIVVLFLLWSVPLIVYIAIGLIAIYQAGWLRVIAWTLPPIWLTTWIVSKYWKAPPFRETASLEPVSVPDFWTPQDAAALKLVEEFRNQLAEIDQVSIADPNRYIQDAQALSHLLAKHYHQDSNKHAFSPLTIVEILSVIHLSVEELEAWILENVPGSDLITVGHLEQVPSAIKALDFVQSMFFVASAIINPTKLLAYPIWRKSGRVTVELQNGLISAIYQVYLRQVSYYLIEMYSGRLQGGSQRYRQQFGHLAAAVHRSSGDTRAQIGRASCRERV